MNELLRGSTNKTLSGVEKVDGGVAIGDQERLQTEALEELGLHLGASLGNGVDGVGTDGVDDVLELLSLDVSELLGLENVNLGEVGAVTHAELLGLAKDIQVGVSLDLRSLSQKLGLFDGSSTLDGSDSGLGLGIGGGLTSSGNMSGLDLHGDQLLLLLLDLDIINNLLALELTLGLLLKTFSFVTGTGLLRLGGDLNGQLDGFLERITGPLVDGLDSLDINVGDDQTIGIESEGVLDGARLVKSEHSLTDDPGALFVEDVEGDGGNGTTNSRSNGLASITDKVRNLEQTTRGVQIVTRGVEVPVVRKTKSQVGVIHGLDIDDIGHEVRAEVKLEGLDAVRFLGLTTRQGQDGEVLIGAKGDKRGTESNTGALLLVVVNLDARVVGGSVGDNAGLVSLPQTQQVLNNIGEVLLPKLLVGIQHIGATHHSTNGTLLDITNVDTLVLVKRDTRAAGDNLNLGRRDIVTRTIDHPTVSRAVNGISILVFLLGAEKKGLFLSQNKHTLNSRLEHLSGLQEKLGLSLPNLTPTEVLLAIGANGIDNHAELAVVQGFDLDIVVHDVLVNIGNVNIAHVLCNQPLLSGLPLLLVSISEGASGAKVDRLGGGQHNPLDGVHQLLINTPEVSPNITNQPLFPGLPGVTVLVCALLPGTKLDRLSRLDDDGPHSFNLNLLDTGDVGTRTTKKPLVSGLPGEVTVLEITSATEELGLIGTNDGQRGNL